MNNLLPANLASLGVKRKQPFNEADLLTLWATPYPIIENYKLWCAESKLIKPFGGGTLIKQIRNIPGWITSGYRDDILNGNKYSAHLYALAIDVAIGDVQLQVQEANIAIKYFSRIGFYPENGFIHVDLAPDNWMQRYNKARFWVITKEETKNFMEFESATDFALSLAAKQKE